jgi:hypothetical protein
LGLTQSEEKGKKKRMKRSKESLWSLWDTIKQRNICTVEVP